MALIAGADGAGAKLKAAAMSGRYDTIHIHNLRLKCHIGATAAERKKIQTITADLALQCSLRKAGKSDLLEDTVDYSVIAGELADLAAGREFCLLEALAECLADACLANHRIISVTVKASKNGILPNVRSVEVEIMRYRG